MKSFQISSVFLMYLMKEFGYILILNKRGGMKWYYIFYHYSKLMEYWALKMKPRLCLHENFISFGTTLILTHFPPKAITMYFSSFFNCYCSPKVDLTCVSPKNFVAVMIDS